MTWTWFVERKEFIVTGLVILAALLFLGFFPENPNLNPIVQSAIVTALIFLVLPLLYCKMVVKRPLSDIGLQKGSWWAGIGGGIVSVTAGLILFFALIHFTPLFEGMRLPASVEQHFLIFLLYEVLLNGWIILLLEVFFRGFVMLYFLRRLGFLAVFVQAALFGALLYFSQDIRPETIPLLLFSPLAGLVAYQTRSILASWGATWFFIFLCDALILIVHP